MYEYKAKVIDVIDGDTIDAEIDLGFDIHLRIRVRLAGVDTAETHSKDPELRAKALEAKKFTAERVMDKDIIIKTIKDRKEKFGRYLAVVVYLEGDTEKILNGELIAVGLAQPYEGGKR